MEEKSETNFPSIQYFLRMKYVASCNPSEELRSRRWQKEDEILLLRWAKQPQYFLFAHHFHFNSGNKKLGKHFSFFLCELEHFK
jgi:hypothetical protein